MDNMMFEDKKKKEEGTKMKTVGSPVEESKASKKADNSFIGIVNGAKAVNIRRAPNKNAEVVKTAMEGDVVEVMDKVGEFYKVKAPSLAGNAAYIMASYVIKKK